MIKSSEKRFSKEKFQKQLNFINKKAPIKSNLSNFVANPKNK
jgi:hypothetical protein